MGATVAARGGSLTAFDRRHIPAAGARCRPPDLNRGLLGIRQTPGAGELIDSVLAVVEGRVIMLSDVRAFLALRLIESPDGGDPVPPVLTALIERQLILEEVARYVVEEPSTAEVEERLTGLVARLGGPEVLDRVLPAIGFTVDDLRQVLRADLRIERYLARRFVSARQPTEDEVAAYFREHADEFRTNSAPPAFDTVRDEARRRLSEALRRELIDGWIASLTARADVFRVSP